MKLLTKTKPRTPFQEILAEAVRIKLDLQKYENPAAPYATKVSAEGMRREALAAAKTTDERVAALREALEAEPNRFPATWAFVRRCAVEIAGPNVRSLARLTAGNPWLRQNGSEAAAPELGLVNATPLEAVVLAVERAGKEYPRNFGPIDDYFGWERRTAQLRQRLAALQEQIETSYGPADLTFHDAPSGLRAQGFVKAAFTVSGGEVNVGPGCGERLVAWVVTQPDVMRQLGVQV